jgi:hypothetical protein
MTTEKMTIRTTKKATTKKATAKTTKKVVARATKKVTAMFGPDSAQLHLGSQIKGSKILFVGRPIKQFFQSQCAP